MNFYKRHIGDYARDTGHLTLLQHGIYTKLLDLYYATEQGIPVDEAERLIGVKNSTEKAAFAIVTRDFFQIRVCEEKNPCPRYIQKRCDFEIANMRVKADTNRNNGKLGGRPPKTHSVPTNNPDGFGKKPTNNLSQNPESREAKLGFDNAKPQPPLTPHGGDGELDENGLKKGEFLDPNTGEAKTPKPKGVKHTSILPTGFQLFWKAWPRHFRKSGMSKCAEKWASLECEKVADKIIAALEAYKTSHDWVREDGQYVPAPIVWLNQHRWEVDIADLKVGIEQTNSDGEDEWAKAHPPPTLKEAIARGLIPPEDIVKFTPELRREAGLE
jgi:uncharacterized protein YdaU (DUF1376 family)